ncbi:MAG TPA: hypothetical protein VGN14_14390 [Candidatus Elarobacter sp.]|jgi:hypothetical protein
MPRLDRVTCKRCHRHSDDVGPISHDGNCRSCGKQAMDDNVDQMHAKRGPNFNRWRAAMIRCAGGTVTDPKLLASERTS